MTDYKLVPIGPTPEMVEAAESAYMPFGDMELALKMAALAAPAVQGEPVAFCEDGTLALAEGTFSTEVDEQLAVDVIEFARRLHSKWATSQPAPDVGGLVEALECALETMENVDGANDCSRGIEAVEEALAAYRKQGGYV